MSHSQYAATQSISKVLESQKSQRWPVNAKTPNKSFNAPLLSYGRNDNTAAKFSGYGNVSRFARL